MSLRPYLYFSGRAEEAIEFYKRALGAETQMLLRFNEAPDPLPPGAVAPGWETKIMHASLLIGGDSLLVSDGHSEAEPAFKNFSLALHLKTPADVDGVFAALSDGGEERMPPDKTFFSQRFAMIVDRFGVSWTLIADA